MLLTMLNNELLHISNKNKKKTIVKIINIQSKPDYNKIEHITVEQNWETKTDEIVLR